MESNNHPSRHGGMVSYKIYKDEVHPLFIAFLKSSARATHIYFTRATEGGSQ